MQNIFAEQDRTVFSDTRIVPLKSHDPEGLADITQHEILALRTDHNLADAHTHQRQSATQRNIVNRLPQLWYESEELTQHALEQRFIQKFFALHQQKTALELNRSMLFYAASIAMMAVATFIMRRRMTVSLIDPCFDNLHDILANMHVPLLPLKEEILTSGPGLYTRLENTVTGDVLALVDPNNPTGASLLTRGGETFDELIRYCRDHHKILMIDLCFASFALMDPQLGRLDIYQRLEASGISYLVIEDTGKTWPVQDAKCALLTCSSDLHAEVYCIQTSILLNVSPFILNMLSAYLDDSKADDFTSIKSVLDENRTYLRHTLSGSRLGLIEPEVPVSVAWLEIKSPELTATTLRELAYGNDVYVLPGTYFFWSRPRVGERFIRIALARDPARFRASIDKLKETLDAL
ncbi:aminotransferase class I/II-fold pyridoxal phosphate-dependent enzyme [Paraburkholderia aspalathi]|uniref:Aspartate/methionine/tyrosine aminotransferase n=1 Tax=Paraburkholderia aspalathi TaxID=1324617 RepID=A0A1I7ACR4_9BURK|nr:aminotransferase class I/II-fold pyridoxal phosphate-dependent enzyme [Paraburkholderia aspalathi]SFT72737.1 Aspartate/methionine/tyrosine aminotransferase [Paraburkholderia aspalathi]